ncbi:MAG: glycerol-3-phosphate dehydrogenase/oxidase [Acidobacteriota bacterium]
MTAQSPARPMRLAQLSDRLFDLAVVGGGITGAAAARDAASRGLSVALLEREDWASGTSWRSSKLIHGGLRYLRGGHFHLVFESLAERARLLALAPHLVEPLEFLFPIHRGRGMPPLLLEAGLTLYDLLALGRPRRHRRLSRRQLLLAERLLESPDLLSGALYPDARTDDARLTLENVLDAMRLGAVAVSRIEVEGFARDRAGRLTGVEARDRESGLPVPVRARVVINATGPWSDRTRRLDETGAPAQLRLSKGAHLTVPAERLPLAHPVAAPLPAGRLLFAIPHGPVTLVGTTDSDYDGSLDEVFAGPADVEELLDEANRTFPSVALTKTDVVATFASLRPLAAQSGRSVQDTSREEAVSVSPSGLVTVTGGKLTTHRRMARRTVDRAVAMLREGSRLAPASATENRPFPGAPGAPFEDFLRRLEREASDAGLDAGAARHLGRRYGARAGGVLALAAAEKALRDPLDPTLPDLAAEVVFAARSEDARSVADVLARRTHLYWQARRQGEDAAPRVADLLARELSWSRARREESLAQYARELSGARRALG